MNISSKQFRRFLFGRPLASDKLAHQRLPKFLALPVFSSDALSSVAYATQEILLQATTIGMAGLALTIPVAATIIIVLALVAISYTQTIYAYPSGGGSYIVARDNLSTNMGLLAAAALLTDYVLTVAVSIAAGVQQITSFFPHLARMHMEVPICLLAVAVVTLANLRGAKESGWFFSIPTYFFLVCMMVMVGVGIVGPMVGYHLMAYSDVMTQAERAQYAAWQIHQQGLAVQLSGFAMIAIALKAFASGCSALTGVEAISNGVQAFKKPESKNAAQTLAAMAILLGIMFLGLSYLAQTNHVIYAHGFDHQTVVAWVSRIVFHNNPVVVGTILFSTAIILLLAANTSYADFPRLVAILARDRFMPRQLSNLGDRLVFANGIVMLGIFSCVLIIAFHGKTDKLIPLYAVGVFLSFTLSQAGMVRHWFRDRGKHWKTKALFNGMGAVATFVVLSVIVYEKTLEGAWVVIIIIPVLMAMFTGINKHYERLRDMLRMSEDDKAVEATDRPHTVLVLLDRLHRGNIKALRYAKLLSNDVRAVRVEVYQDAKVSEMVRREWNQWGGDIPLVNIASPYRSLFEPIVEYVKQVREDRPDHIVTVILPEFIVDKWYYRVLHANHAAMLRHALGNIRGVIITGVRFYTD
ncbi:MAG: APC family permease [Armatimonadota bacterium]